MENTCFKACHLWKKYGDRCPNYVIGYWKQEGSSTEKRIEDCVPRRTLEQLKKIHSILLGLHKASNEERNASNALAGVLVKVVKAAEKGQVLINGLDTETPQISLTGELQEGFPEG